MGCWVSIPFSAQKYLAHLVSDGGRIEYRDPITWETVLSTLTQSDKIPLFSSLLLTCFPSTWLSLCVIL